jgi:hypothetical protein
MKIVSQYRRQLRTNRRFIFENIFDLEHVCIVHRRWFRDLRVRVQRPDYVEYRLKSLFYGFRQDVLVKGAKVDNDHYWYEFNGRLAQIRVEGAISGPDGDVDLTETIIYRFPWLLAPVFLLLWPLFRRQKQNILTDDTKLLERVYALSQTGFRRHEFSGSRVLVYGGDGFFGRLLVEDLLQSSDARIVVASRTPKPGNLPTVPDRLTFVESDLNEYDSVLEALKGINVAICCAGPFQGLTLNLLRACISRKVHYVDVADDRGFVERCYQKRSEIEASGIKAFVGCSVVPGISTLLCACAQKEIRSIDKVRIFITPGTRHPRGPGSFACLLSTVGEEFPIPKEGYTATIRGWTGKERIIFPDPLGARNVYFVVNIADYFLQPLYFNTPTVEFKIGAELDLLNHALTFVRMQKQFRFHNLKWNWFIPLARFFISIASAFGTTQGGVIVEVSGRGETGTPDKTSLCVFAPAKGEIIPSILPSLATQMILSGEARHSGIVPLPHWLPMEKLIEEFGKRGVQLAVRNGDSPEWVLVNRERATIGA